MEPVTERSNVIPLKPHYALFNPSLRQQLTAGVSPHTDKPDEVVTVVEQVASAYLVANVRRFAVRLTERVLERVFG